MISYKLYAFHVPKLLGSAQPILFEVFVYVLVFVHHYLPIARNIDQKYTDYRIFKEDLTSLFFEKQKSPHMAGWRLTT